MSELPFKPIRLIHDGKAGIQALLESLPSRVVKLSDYQLQAFLHEVDFLLEDPGSANTPEIENWLWLIHSIITDEIDARWLIQRLQDRGIVSQEGGL